jgi:hypothetical protein
MITITPRVVHRFVRNMRSSSVGGVCDLVHARLRDSAFRPDTTASYIPFPSFTVWFLPPPLFERVNSVTRGDRRKVCCLPSVGEVGHNISLRSNFSNLLCHSPLQALKAWHLLVGTLLRLSSRKLRWRFLFRIKLLFVQDSCCVIHCCFLAISMGDIAMWDFSKW